MSDLGKPTEQNNPRYLGEVAVAFRDSILERVKIAPHDDFEEAVDRAAGVIRAQGRERASKLNDLLDFLMKRYVETADILEIRASLKSRTIPAEPVAIGLGGVPVLIIAELIASHRLRQDFATLANWAPFSERYGNIIMAA